MPVNSDSNFVVSIASYPKRDPLLPAVFQALSRQTVWPRKWVLVLSVEDYPKGVPQHLLRLERRGLDILWVENNPYAVKKLVPTIKKYPDDAVITFDDELIYGKTVIEKLVKASDHNPNAIIGHVGKKLRQRNGKLGMLYRSKQAATIATNSEEIYFLGGSGTYYPAQALDIRVSDLEAIHRIVPGRGSDIWFWAAAVAKGTRQICLGTTTDRHLYFSIPLNENTKPKDRPGTDVMLERFQMAIDFFGIRDLLLERLPEHADNNNLG